MILWPGLLSYFLGRKVHATTELIEWILGEMGSTFGAGEVVEMVRMLVAQSGYEEMDDHLVCGGSGASTLEEAREFWRKWEMQRREEIGEFLDGLGEFMEGKKNWPGWTAEINSRLSDRFGRDMFVRYLPDLKLRFLLFRLLDQSSSSSSLVSKILCTTDVEDGGAWSLCSPAQRLQKVKQYIRAFMLFWHVEEQQWFLPVKFVNETSLQGLIAPAWRPEVVEIRALSRDPTPSFILGSTSLWEYREGQKMASRCSDDLSVQLTALFHSMRDQNPRRCMTSLLNYKIFCARANYNSL